MEMVIQIAQCILLTSAAILVATIAAVCFYAVVIGIQSSIEDRHKKNKGDEDES